MTGLTARSVQWQHQRSLSFSLNIRAIDSAIWPTFSTACFESFAQFFRPDDRNESFQVVLTSHCEQNSDKSLINLMTVQFSHNRRFGTRKERNVSFANVKNSMKICKIYIYRNLGLWYHASWKDWPDTLTTAIWCEHWKSSGIEKTAAVRKEPALIKRRQLIKSEAWQSEGGKPEEESM